MQSEMTSEHSSPENKKKKNDSSCVKNCYFYLPIIKQARLAAETVQSQQAAASQL